VTTVTTSATALPQPVRSTASVRDAKAHLSSLLRQVRLGTEVVITDRGRPVARLVPVSDESAAAVLARLVERGVVGPSPPGPPEAIAAGLLPPGLAVRYLEQDRDRG